MEKLNQKELKMLIEQVIKTMVNESYALPSLIEEYASKFKFVQTQYNNFWDSGEITYAKFYNIQLTADQFKNEYEVKSNKILSIISDKTATTEDEYYNNMEKYRDIENGLSDLSKKIEFFASEINTAADVLRQYDDIEYNLNIF